MNIDEFLEYMNTHNRVEVGCETFTMFHSLSQRALKITMELNNKYHSPEEIVEIFSELTNNISTLYELFSLFLNFCGIIRLKSLSLVN